MISLVSGGTDKYFLLIVRNYCIALQFVYRYSGPTVGFGSVTSNIYGCRLEKMSREGSADKKKNYVIIM
jgi:hypothetical protein